MSQNILKEKMKRRNNFFVFLLVLLVSMAGAYASTGLNVVLSNQNPNPVSPGNYVFLNVQVANSGELAIDETTIQMLDNDNFKVAQGTNSIQNLGLIPPRSTDLTGSFAIARYKVLVDDETPIGENTVEFVVRARGAQPVTFDFEVLVQDQNPTIELSKVELESIEAGNSQEATFIFENRNNVDLKNVIVTLDLKNVEDTVLSTKSGSNSFFIPTIEAYGKSEVKFGLVAAPDALSKPYLLPIDLTYEDALGNSYTKDVVASIKVFSEPELTFDIDSQEVYTEGRGRVTFALANPGTSTVKGVQVRFLDTENYEVIEGTYQYIGDLNPDDFQTIQANIYLGLEAKELLAELSYSDSYNNRIVEQVSLPVKIYGELELEQFGLAQKGGSSTSTLVIVAIVLVLVYFGYKKLTKPKKK